MKRHSPAQQLREAKQIAKDHGMVVIEKQIARGETDYFVYRFVPGRGKVFLGHRKQIEMLRRWVAKLADVKPAADMRVAA